ncbi:acetate kinase [Pseudonocardia ammonioxydans]|uniref:Acetate kinase n=1 Tax=Pseudonocardia ammonioxydans TaxID=260086 RepID=A0A1I5H675_PSUAM|nr:acetate/propionate family kinase [Pseudonocardia ammonioxydans]SFO43764.1 acetate kinase [Pseudonocardia ammonioxydans]
MRTLVINAGSSSLKLALLDQDDGTVRTLDTDTVDPDGLAEALPGLAGDPPPDAVGHRVVHGGDEFTGPVAVDDAVLDRIDALRGLAPLHQGPALDALRRARALLPDAAHVACFDTAFHRTIPAAAATYAVPARWRTEFGVRRYGFHGMAHEWSTRRTGELLDRDPADLRIVNAHLGAGASLCAIDRGISVDTTMGFTPTSGLVMGTRSGDLDPAVPPWLAGRGLDPDDVADALNRDSGLLALAGESDPRHIQDAADDGDARSAAALDVWAHHARAGVAAMIAALGGLDVLTFSGGVGEHQPRMRERAVRGLEFLGLRLDPARNDEAHSGDAVLSPDGAAVTTAVVTAREDVVIAEQVAAVLG